jgi:enoyl-CoA hydratase
MTITVEDQSSIRVITIDRPEVRNAVDKPTAQDLFDAFVEFDADDDLAVAVLTGAGGTFCAGADLKAIAIDKGNIITTPVAGEIVGSLGPMGPTRLQLSKPVIAAVEGFAVAGGLELACWCDLRVAARDATFGVFCRRWGVPMIDGGNIRLPRLIGQSRAADMILTGREITAAEAEQFGLANRVVEHGEALDAALELAAALASLPQRCLRSDRTAMLDQWSLDLGEALAHEATLGMATIRSRETQEGAARFASGAGRHGQSE